VTMSMKITTGTVTAGGAWGVFDIVRGLSASQRVVGTLAYDFFTTTDPVMYPGDQTVDPSGGVGNIRSITGSVPAAGAEISEACPVGARWEPVSFTFSLTTSAAVGNRVVALTIDDGANIYFRDSPNVVQAASLTDIYCFAQGQSKLAAPFASDVLGNLPARLTMLAGHRIRTVRAAGDVADQYTAPQYLVRETFEA